MKTAQEIDALSLEQLRVAVAEAMGWKRKGTIGHSRYPAYAHPDGRRATIVNLPPYATSHDALAPVLDWLTEQQKWDFTFQLCHGLDVDAFCHSLNSLFKLATAAPADKARAVLKCLL